MAQVIFDDNAYPVDLDQSAEDVLKNLVPADRLQHCELFFHSRKIARQQKLQEITGLDGAPTIRVLERKVTKIEAPPANLRELVVGMHERVRNFSHSEDRLMVAYLWQMDCIERLLARHPIILEQPCLLQVIRDYSLMTAMFHEEHGFFHQHPNYIEIVEKLLADVMNVNRYQRRAVAESMSQILQRRMATQPAQASASASQSNQFITQDMLRNALSNALPGGGVIPPEPSSPTVTASAPAIDMPTSSTASAPPASPSPRYEEQYASQLTTLNELGFTNASLNVDVLRTVEGNVEGALDLLIALRHSEN